MKAAERMRPILETWIQSKEEDANNGNKFQKKRRKRTSFPPEYIQLLNEYFQKNPKPTMEEMQVIASKINLDITTVKVWFCNKKQSLKRLGQPVYNRNNKVKPELLERKPKRKTESTSGIFQMATPTGMKTILPVSTPTGTVTMPFFISQDGNAIPIVSASAVNNGNATVAAQTVNATGAHQISSSLSQQIVHLSQVPFVTSMAVVNNNLQNNVSTEGTPTQIISSGRILPSGSVLLPGGALAAHQTHLQQNNLNQNNLNDAAVIIGENLQAAAGTHPMSVNGTSRDNAGLKHGMKGALTDKDLESDEVCVSDDSMKSEKLIPRNNEAQSAE